MCGIVGYFHPNRLAESVSALYTAGQLIRHRGPDDEGYAAFHLGHNQHKSWTGPDSSLDLQKQMSLITEDSSFPHHLAFGFRRFSIVDLTSRGHQPYWNPDRSVCLIYNGEIYNYKEIKQELEAAGYPFISTCDTEVLLASYLHWGIDCLNRFNGPIALVLYDQKRQRLILARDRIGKSPLYYSVLEGSLYWASEIKSIFSLAGQNSFTINEQAVYDYLTYGWRDLDHTTFWKGIHTVPSASWIEWPIDQTPDFDKFTGKIRRYWDFPSSRINSQELSFSKAQDQFFELLTDAVRIRARADAPLAFSLSGGLDSSSLVGIAVKQLRKSITTYSVKLPGHPDDEEGYANQVFQRYKDKMDYRVYIPGDDDFWNQADTFIPLQEEPFPYMNTELFQAYFRQARQDGFKVMIVGAGGDELLAGYRHYFFPFLVHLCSQKKYFRMLKNLFLNTELFPGYWTRTRIRYGLRILKNQKDRLPVQHSFYNPTSNSRIQPFLKNDFVFNNILCREGMPREFHSLMKGLMSQWQMNYWLRTSNRSHFGVPIEPRSPLLDYRLIEFCYQLPAEYLIHNGWTKYILRKSTEAMLPRSISWNRTKRGFPFNSDVWFKKSKPIATRCFQRARENPFLNTQAIIEQYDQWIRKDPKLLWRCLSLALWWIRVVQGEPLNDLIK